MKNIVWGILFLLVVSTLESCTKTEAISFSENTFEKDVDKLVGQMTLEEKISELTQDAPANKRLGIPMMRYSECLHGLWLDDATNYPQAIRRCHELSSGNRFGINMGTGTFEGNDHSNCKGSACR